MAAAVLAGCAAAPEAANSPQPTTSATGGVVAAATSAARSDTGALPRPVIAPPAAASAPQVAVRPPALPGAAAPPPFAEVTRDAKSTAGLLTIWTRDDKTWLEIPTERLNQPLLLGSTLATGLGQGLLPGLGSGYKLIELRRVGNTVQMVQRNLLVRAAEGQPLARALAESFSESLLAAAPLASAPHPQRRSLLVDAMALLSADLMGLQRGIEITFRVPYSVDRANTHIERWSTNEPATMIAVRTHFSVPRLPLPPVGMPPANPAALPSPPTLVPDARSFFLTQVHTIALPPAAPMSPRRADQRVGFFANAFHDYGVDAGSDRRTHQILRWRLEKKDPAAEVSEPKEPIRVVMDRNIPEKWRPTVRAAIQEWNKSFERAGFRGALAVEQQAADADWSTYERDRILAVRWFAHEVGGYVAFAQFQSDPRTGEILRASASVPENLVRFWRNDVADEGHRPAAPWTEVGSSAHEGLCDHSRDFAEQAAFALQLLQARGELLATGPEAEAFIADALKQTTMHEIGHALGLRHNFKASSGVTRAQLRDAAFTARQGISNSVMDYNAVNLPLAQEAPSHYFMGAPGAYDHWAIEYGYRQFPAAREAEELARIARRSEQDPTLDYATDEDLADPDPLIARRDLGDDPLAFAQRSIVLARELWTRSQARTPAADDDFTQRTRALRRGLAAFLQAVPTATRYIGGAYTTRALAGAQRALVTPVPAAQQRAALDLLTREVFASSSFRFEPAFMSRLGFDRLEFRGGSNDYSLPEAVLNIQRAALDRLMSESVAAQLASAETKVTDQSTLFSYAELQERLRDAVWSEVAPPPKAGARTLGKPAAEAGSGPPPTEIDSMRRNLQREHLRRLAGGVLRPAAAVAADVRSVHRQVAAQLEASLKAALQARNWTPGARAHLADSLATLGEALKAPLLKQGV